MSRSFAMEMAPEEAQARFREEIGKSLAEMGFKLTTDTPGHLVFEPGYLIGTGPARLLWISGFATAWYFWRQASGQRLEADFSPAGGGCRVDVYGNASRSVRDAIAVLGRLGHWPSSADDPDWVAAGVEMQSEDPYSEWDDVDIDPQDLDRTTRRALKKAGRLK